MDFTRSQILGRYRMVLRVLSRHGFGILGEKLGGARTGRGERLRRAAEELGPVFVKLGQMLSTRADLLPPDIVAALERLQDQVSPFPSGQVRAVVEEELGLPLEELFARFDPQPVAAASLGQVHEALLADGREVAVKVQRPGIREQVELDLRVLQSLAATAARRSRTARMYDLPAVAREFAVTLRSELDFRLEAASAERFRRNFAGDPDVRFPAVIPSRSTGRVLTLERVGGLRVTDRPALLQAGIDPAALARRLASAIFKMVLRDGFFHADPHPGNLFVTDGGVIVFVDMGMVGELSPAMQANVVEYVLGVVGNDPDRVVEAILRMGVVGRPGITGSLRKEVERLQRKYGDVPLRQVEFGPALLETLAVARRFEITFPSGYTLLLKTMSTLEAVSRQIDPDATLVGLAAPIAELLMKGQLEPGRLLQRFGRDVLDAGRYTLRLPRQASRVLQHLEQGELKVGLDHTGLDPALQRLSAIANRLALAILLASLIIGTALVSSSGRGSLLQSYSVADMGFLLIGAVGLWLVISILGSERK